MPSRGDTGRGLRAGDGRPARSRLREACRLPHLRALSLALAEQQRVRRRRDEVVRVVRDQRERTGAASAVGIEGTQQHLVRRTAAVRRDGEPRSAEIRRDEGRDRGSTSRKSSRDWLSRPSKAYGRDVAEMWPRCSRDTAEIQPRCSPDTTEIQPKHHLRGRRRPRRGRAAAAGISRIISAKISARSRRRPRRGRAASAARAGSRQPSSFAPRPSTWRREAGGAARRAQTAGGARPPRRHSPPHSPPGWCAPAHHACASREEQRLRRIHPGARLLARCMCEACAPAPRLLSYI